MPIRTGIIGGIGVLLGVVLVFLAITLVPAAVAQQTPAQSCFVSMEHFRQALVAVNSGDAEGPVGNPSSEGDGDCFVSMDQFREALVAINSGRVSEPTPVSTVRPTPTATAPGAVRSFDSASVDPGERVVVTVRHDFGGRVEEKLPRGFSYVSSSLDSALVIERGQAVRFIVLTGNSFTYTVTAPDAPGAYSFSGTLRDLERRDYPVGGDTGITVNGTVNGTIEEPTSTPAPVATPVSTVIPTPVPTAVSTAAPPVRGTSTPTATSTATAVPVTPGWNGICPDDSNYGDPNYPGWAPPGATSLSDCYRNRSTWAELWADFKKRIDDSKITPSPTPTATSIPAGTVSCEGKPISGAWCREVTSTVENYHPSKTCTYTGWQNDRGSIRYNAHTDPGCPSGPGAWGRYPNGLCVNPGGGSPPCRNP